MFELFSTLKDTPLPIVLTLAGIVFLFLGIVGNIKQLQTEPLAPGARKLAGGTGAALLIVGLALYIIPVGPSAGQPTATPAATEVAAVPTTPPPVATEVATEAASAAPTEAAGAMPTLNAQGYPVMVDDTGSQMVQVPAQAFLMGSVTGYSDEKPIHHVVLTKDYWMDVYEVSNKQYKACVDAGTCDPPHLFGSSTQSSYYATSQFEDFPVVTIDWTMADKFCRVFRGGRLPTEAEWEFAARGTDQRTYPWGNDAPSCNLINFSPEKDRACVGDTKPVNFYPQGASPFGLLNMAGNVWEWVSDWYGSYVGLPPQDPTGAPGGTQHILRGGSWINDASNITTTIRYAQSAGAYGLNYGMRCARDAQ